VSASVATEDFPKLWLSMGIRFQSTYFETLVAYYSCEKKTRPWAKPRYGSVIERLFGQPTPNCPQPDWQYPDHETGPPGDEIHLATRASSLDAGDLYAYLCIWAYEVYDQQIHPRWE